MSKDYPITALTINQKYRFKAQVNSSSFLFRDLTLTSLPLPGSTPRGLTVGGDNITDFSRRQSFTSISTTSQLPIPTIKVIKNIKITIKEPIFTGPNHRESTSLSNMDETIIREAELNTLTLEDDLFRIYNKSEPSSKKRKRNINTCEYDFSVSITWKKNIVDFSSRTTTAANKNLLDKPIQFLVKYKKHRYICYTHIKYLTSYFGLRTRELKERKIKEILETIY